MKLTGALIYKAAAAAAAVAERTEERTARLGTGEEAPMVHGECKRNGV